MNLDLQKYLHVRILELFHGVIKIIPAKEKEVIDLRWKVHLHIESKFSFFFVLI